jgi:hypothetical protein
MQQQPTIIQTPPPQPQPTAQDAVTTVANTIFDLLASCGHDLATATRRRDTSGQDHALGQLDILAELIARLNLGTAIENLKHPGFEQ